MVMMLIEMANSNRDCLHLSRLSSAIISTMILREKSPNTKFFSGLHFPAFGLNMERYSVALLIQSKCGKIRTRKNSVFGYFSHNVMNSVSERANNCKKFSIYWYSLSLDSINHTLPSHFFHLLAWCDIFHRSFGQIIMM